MKKNIKRAATAAAVVAIAGLAFFAGIHKGSAGKIDTRDVTSWTTGKGCLALDMADGSEWYSYDDGNQCIDLSDVNGWNIDGNTLEIVVDGHSYIIDK